MKWLRWAGRGLYYGVYRGARGYGFPKTPAHWEHEYRSGRWRYLSSQEERPAQMVLLGYVVNHCAWPSVLDVGCGDGVLFGMLQRFPLAEYHGLDISEEALARLRTRAIAPSQGPAPSRITFTRGDFETYVPPRSYDVLVFNNSLMYADDPLWVVERFASCLADGGIVVVSLCYNRWQFPIWKRLERRFKVLHAASVSNEQGLVWHVRVLERGPACGDLRKKDELVTRSHAHTCRTSA